MHIVMDEGSPRVLVGLAEVISLKGFGNNDIQLGEKVRIVCSPGDEPFYKAYMGVKAAGYDCTWGTVGEHYSVVYVYPYIEA